VHSNHRKQLFEKRKEPSPPVRILYLSAEVAPYSKTGGLADVAQALPRALAALGHEVWVASPRYASVDVTATEVARFTLRFPFAEVSVGVEQATVGPRHHLLFVNCSGFHDRPGLYGDDDGSYADNARRFALFSMGALTAAQALNLAPDIVHCNDWQTGLVPAALRHGFAHLWPSVRTVFTIHNLAYQGLFPRAEAAALGLPPSLYTIDGYEFWGQLSLLKGGLALADALTTVSPSYALEIQTKAFGAGLEGLLSLRAKSLTGILNGLDESEWNAANDVFLPKPFSIADVGPRALAKAALLTRAGLAPPAAGMPVFGSLGRIVEQKGADLLQAALPPFLEAGARMVVLGSGEQAARDEWSVLQKRFPHAVHCTFGFDDPLAHLIYGGSDFFVMPSRYEPCGLTQMAAMAYGSVPIVHGVGGLRDTVKDFSEAQGTGIVFHRPTVEALRSAMERAVHLLRDPIRHAAVQRTAMRQRFTWEAATQATVQIYAGLMPERTRFSNCSN
jgi:starch synthase